MYCKLSKQNELLVVKMRYAITIVWKAAKSLRIVPDVTSRRTSPEFTFTGKQISGGGEMLCQRVMFLVHGHSETRPVEPVVGGRRFE